MAFHLATYGEAMDIAFKRWYVYLAQFFYGFDLLFLIIA